MKLTLFNTFGQQVAALKSSENSVSVPLNYAPGIYYLMVKESRKTYFHKLVIR